MHCREHGLLPVGATGFTDRELEYLVAVRARGPRFFTEERREGRWFCRFSSFTCAIALPGGRTLEILPKVAGFDESASRGLVMRMLAAADLAPSLEDAPADYAVSPSLIEAYLRFAADLAVQQVRLGLVHSYRREDFRLPMVRGRLLIARQLARLPERVDTHFVSADVFVADTPVNRAIKAGVVCVGRLARSHATLAKCREVIARMDAVGDLRTDRRTLAETFGQLRLDRRHGRLVSLLKALALVILGSGTAPEAGLESPGPTLLFEMNSLFEALLAARLRTVATGRAVRVQDTRHTFDVAGCFKLRPDLVVETAGVPTLVVDAKWKSLPKGLASVDDGDLRQVFAYARVLRTPVAALVYPRLDATPVVRHDTIVADGSGVRLVLRQVTLPSGGGWASLDQDLIALLATGGVSTPSFTNLSASA
jgi:5-methylcytosine-specific restriction endonuclease McrBC regulatory subunit McrC